MIAESRRTATASGLHRSSAHHFLVVSISLCVCAGTSLGFGASSPCNSSLTALILSARWGQGTISADQALRCLEARARDNVLICAELAQAVYEVDELNAGQIFDRGPCHEQLPDVIRLRAPWPWVSSLARYLSEDQLDREPDLAILFLGSPRVADRVEFSRRVAELDHRRLLDQVVVSLSSVTRPYDSSLWRSPGGPIWWVAGIPEIADRFASNPGGEVAAAQIRSVGCRWVEAALEANVDLERLYMSAQGIEALQGVLCEPDQRN